MKLNYWVIKNQRDSSCYDIRSQTKAGALAALAARLESGEEPDDWSPYVEKHSLEYSSAFDLLDEALGENRAWSLERSYPIATQIRFYKSNDLGHLLD